jgi:hypothetical protein
MAGNPTPKTTTRPRNRRNRIRRPTPAPETNGLQVSTHRGALHIKLNLTVRRKVAWFILLAAGAALLLLASSLNEEIRSILIEALLALLQALIFGERKKG